MAELLIAIVILGLGLLTVATMFPIAWTKARDLAEFNTQTAITASAENTLKLVANVANAVGTIPGASSFKGDPVSLRRPDPWVHPLHMENVFATDPDLLDPRPFFGGDFQDALGAGNPVGELNPGGLNFTPLPNAQVSLYERMYPPLSPVPDPNLMGVAEFSAKMEQWNTLFDHRRFCWGAFHKLDYDPMPPGQPPTVNEPRSFTFYFVTLRRGQPTHRYARQATGPGPATPPTFVIPTNIPGSIPTTATLPAALPTVEDVRLPVPWRVQIEIVVPPVLTPPVFETGIPAQAITNSTLYPTNNLVTDMIQRGSFLIDELSGKVYKVTDREIDPGNPDRALLTLDQEITFAELDVINPGAGVADPGEFLRTVWVYPPPVERVGSVVTFTGPQPVVGIDVRRMTFSP